MFDVQSNAAVNSEKSLTTIGSAELPYKVLSRVIKPPASPSHDWMAFG